VAGGKFGDDMTEGTKSFLVGCHQFLLHPLWVLMAWRLRFKKWPAWWQVICIFLHDVGICGRNYLFDPEAKKGHWELGAQWSAELVWKLTSIEEKARLLSVGWTRAYSLCAGHSPSDSGFPRSDLFWADKMSWLVAPMWWLWWNYWVERFVTRPEERKKA